MDEGYRLEREIKALERELAAKQPRLFEVRKDRVASTLMHNYVLLGTEGPTYLSDLFSLPTDLVLFHVMADCEFCDAWLTSIEHLAQKLRGSTSLAVVSPQPVEELALRAGAMDWTIPYYSTETCNLSEDIDFLRSGHGIAGIVACQLVGDEIYMVAKAPFGPSPFCSMRIFADKILHGSHVGRMMRMLNGRVHMAEVYWLMVGLLMEEYRRVYYNYELDR